MVDGQSPTGQKPEPFSSHILTGLESSFPNQPKDHTVTSTICISGRFKISQTSKICWAVQLTSLLRFGLINWILDQTLVLDYHHLSSQHLHSLELKASAHHNLASFAYCFAVSACLLSLLFCLEALASCLTCLSLIKVSKCKEPIHLLPQQTSWISTTL